MLKRQTCAQPTSYRSANESYFRPDDFRGASNSQAPPVAPMIARPAAATAAVNASTTAPQALPLTAQPGQLRP